MEIEKALENLLKNHLSLKAIHKGQVCFGLAPESWKGAYQTFFQVSDPPELRRLGVPRPRYQINSFSPDQAISAKMAEITKDILDGFAGVMGGAAGKVVMNASYVDTAGDLAEPESGLFNRPIDVKIQYRR